MLIKRSSRSWKGKICELITSTKLDSKWSFISLDFELRHIIKSLVTIWCKCFVRVWKGCFTANQSEWMWNWGIDSKQEMRRPWQGLWSKKGDDPLKENKVFFWGRLDAFAYSAISCSHIVTVTWVDDQMTHSYRVSKLIGFRFLLYKESDLPTAATKPLEIALKEENKAIRSVIFLILKNLLHFVCLLWVSQENNSNSLVITAMFFQD